MNKIKQSHEDYTSLVWITAKEAAKLFRTTVAAIRNMVYRRKLKAYKPFGKLLFKRAELERLIERSALTGGLNGY